MADNGYLETIYDLNDTATGAAKTLMTEGQIETAERLLFTVELNWDEYNQRKYNDCAGILVDEARARLKGVKIDEQKRTEINDSASLIAGYFTPSTD